MTALTLPEGRPGRLLAVGLALFSVLVLWTLAASPLIDFYTSRAQQLADDQLRAQHMATITSEAPDLRRQLAARHGIKPVVTELLQGNSDALALASLQTDVQQLAGGASVAIASIETLPATRTGGLVRIGLHLHASGDYPALVRFLGSVRDAQPAMLADDLAITAQGPNATSRFDIDVSLYAFRPAS